MTTSAMATQQTSGLSWLKTAGKILYIVMVLAIAFVVYKSSWYAGTTWLLLAGLGYILFFLEADKRKFYLFVLVNLAIIAFVGGFIQGHLMRNARLVRFIQENALLTFLLDGYRETVIWSTVIGLIIALLLTLIPLLIIAYVGAVYVLALHQMDGVNWWDAMRYLITLLLDINLPFIVVENGQALLTKKAARLDVIGGPGHLIIKQGNVVVLERGGKITRIVNAGVTKLKSLETIRNIFPLNGQSNSDQVKHMLTKDRIPLNITISISFQIEPAAEAEKRVESRIAPDGEALTAKLDDGMYQVYEGTIRKAALMSQAPSFKQRHLEKCWEQFCYDVEETDWKKIAGGVPGGDLRDYIMSHRFDELFELSGGADGAEPELRVNKRKIYEIEQAILKQIKPGKAKNLGILVRSVDIGRITFPEDARCLLLHHWAAPWKQQIDLIGAETKLQGNLLEAQSQAQQLMLKVQSELNVANLRAQAIVINARAEAQKRILEGHSEAEAHAAFFRCIVESLRVDGRPLDELTGAILQQLAGSYASVNDVETFMKVQSKINQQNFMIGQNIGRNGSIEVDNNLSS